MEIKVACIRWWKPLLLAALICVAALSFLVYNVINIVDYELRFILPDDFRGQFFLIEDSIAGIPLARRGVNVIRVRSSDSTILVRDMWLLEHWHRETFNERSGKEIKYDNTPIEGPKVAWALHSAEVTCYIIGTYNEYAKYKNKFTGHKSDYINVTGKRNGGEWH